jgi:hypothetical protein
MTRARVVRQLFLIGPDLLNCLSVEEVEATYADMVEMDIAKPPYAEFDIRMPLMAYGKNLGRFLDYYKTDLEKLEHGEQASLGKEERNLLIGLSVLSDNEIKVLSSMNFDLNYSFNFDDNSKEQHSFFLSRNNWVSGKKHIASKEATDHVFKMLVVLLATRNVIREVKPNKLAKLGIGKHLYASTTTLKIGNVTETGGEQTGAGIVRRPHLRRGHVRRQKYGPGLQFEKKIFIEAVFVNADEGWIAERTAYNMSRAA